MTEWRDKMIYSSNILREVNVRIKYFTTWMYGGNEQFPDNNFDLCIDPPYGIGIDGQKESICKKSQA